MPEDLIGLESGQDNELISWPNVVSPIEAAGDSSLEAITVLWYQPETVECFPSALDSRSQGKLIKLKSGGPKNVARIPPDISSICLCLCPGCLFKYKSSSALLRIANVVGYRLNHG